MRADFIHPKDLTSKDLCDWRAIRASNPRYNSPYFTPEFTQIAGECRGDARVLVGRDETGVGRVFLPLQVASTGFARPLAAPLADYHAPIVRDGDEVLVPQLLNSAGLQAFGYFGLPATDRAYSKYARGRQGASMADLSAGFETYLEERRSEFPKHFKNMRRKIRQIERELGDIEVLFHEPREDILDTLIDWKRAQFQRTGLHDVLAPDWVAPMLKRCMKAGGEDFSGVLATMRIDGELAAVEMDIRSGPLVHGWIAAYNPAFAAQSPGLILVLKMMELGEELGVTHYDFGVGEAQYKKYFTSYQFPVDDGLIPAESLSGWVRRTSGDAWRMMEQAPIGPAGKVASRIRRRMDNILAVETTMAGRARGFMQAINKRSPHSA